MINYVLHATSICFVFYFFFIIIWKLLNINSFIPHIQECLKKPILFTESWCNSICFCFNGYNWFLFWKFLQSNLWFYHELFLSTGISANIGKLWFHSWSNFLFSKHLLSRWLNLLSSKKNKMSIITRTKSFTCPNMLQYRTINWIKFLSMPIRMQSDTNRHWINR